MLEGNGVTFNWKADNLSVLTTADTLDKTFTDGDNGDDDGDGDSVDDDTSQKEDCCYDNLDTDLFELED